MPHLLAHPPARGRPGPKDGASSERPGLLGWLPLPLCAAVIGCLWASGADTPHPQPLLLGVMNFLCLTLSSGLVAFLAARSFRSRAQASVLLLGAGSVIWGLCGAISPAVRPTDANAQITIYNLSACAAGLCHFAGALSLLRRPRALTGSSIWLTLAYVSAAAFVALVVLAWASGWLPAFYDPASGPTRTRQGVMAFATLVFAATAGVLWARPAPTRFTRWYTIALALLGVGLLGVLLQRRFDTWIGWAGRASQWLGGLYMLRAAFAALTESRQWGISIETELFEARRKTETLLETISDGFMLLDHNWRILYLNTAAERFFGCRSAALLHTSFLEAYPASATGRFQTEFRRAFAEGVPVQFEEFYPEPLNRWLECRAYPGAEGLTVLFRDITELKRTHEELRAAQDSLRAHADRLEAEVAQRTAKLQETVTELEHFSYTIAHDMRAPLRAMHGYAEIVLEEAAGRDGRITFEYLERIQRAATRMDQLITGALNYSRTISGAMELRPVDLAALLRGLLESYPHLAAEKARISLPGSMPWVLGNEAALTQCFSNLLGNAVKFVAPGVRPEIVVRAEPRGDRLRIWVEDNGIGISRQGQERLFQMFSRLNPVYEGTGIGLAVVKKVVQRMGGSSGVESEPGKGSRFWVELREAVAPVQQPAVG